VSLAFIGDVSALEADEDPDADGDTFDTRLKEAAEDTLVSAFQPTNCSGSYRSSCVTALKSAA
jgi:hypothetical protein